MKYKSLFIVCCINLLLIGHSFSQYSTIASNVLIQDVLSIQYDLFFTTDDLDRSLLKHLKKDKKVILNLVNPGEEFNRTDMIMEGLPNKRLIVFGKSSREAGFVLYETGGNAPYNTCIVYKKKGKKISDIAAARLGNEVDSFEKLLLAIKENNFLIMGK